MITITTETKRFTLKTDPDQSDKLFNEIVRHLIGRKPSGGAVMNVQGGMIKNERDGERVFRWIC